MVSAATHHNRFPWLALIHAASVADPGNRPGAPSYRTVIQGFLGQLPLNGDLPYLICSSGPMASSADRNQEK